MNKHSITQHPTHVDPNTLTTPAYATGPRTFRINGIAVTGINQICGEPQWSLPLPEPLPPTLNAAFVGGYDPTPGATDAFPLTPANCDSDIILATTTDQAFAAASGAPELDPRLKNIPLRRVPVIADNHGVRDTLPLLSAMTPNPLPPTRGYPNDPISLGAWLNARGRMVIKCKADGSVTLKISYRNLIPNGVYSVWGVWLTTPPGATDPGIVPLPFGGVPNAIVPDHRGRAVYRRELPACPVDPTPDGSQLLFVSTAYHSDTNLYGAVPEPLFVDISVRASDGTTFSSPLGPGGVTHNHVDFLVTGSQLH